MVATGLGTDPEHFFHLDHGPLAEHIHLRQGPRDKMIDSILSAISRQVRIRVSYTKTEAASKKRQTNKFLFDPYYLSLRVGKLYLVGTHPEDKTGTLVSLVFKRITMVSDTADTFERNARATLKDHYKHCFGQWVPRGDAKPLDITLKVDAGWLLDLFSESNFNPEAQVEPGNEGGQVRLKLYDTPDLESWLFGLHPHAQVVTPEKLRLRLKARALEAVKLLA